jgi:O-antigen/teichoic acid export membrane protein
MLVSLMVGAVTWFGTFWLSRQPDGFESVAIVNTGLQWRGPVLLLAASIGSVAIPVFSRLSENPDIHASNRLRKKLSLLNGASALIVSLALILCSGPLLALYGKEFSGGKLVFSLLVATTVPQVLVNIFMQHLVGKGEMFLQLKLHLFQVVPLVVGFIWLIPKFFALGYAISLLISTIAFLFGVIYTLGRIKVK